MKMIIYHFNRHTDFPSLSGTFGIPSWLAHRPKMPKEPSSPSRSNARKERHCINERIDNEMNPGQRTTMYKNNSRDSRKFKGCSTLQLHRKLKDLSSAVGYYFYTNRYPKL